jgi:carboxyl-terminal processing protease
MTRILFLFFLISSTTFGQTTKKLSKPEKDFETFWTTFRDNYAFFKLKGVNWDSAYIKYRPLVTKKIKEKQLISILGQMVEPLKDGHITISKGEEILFKSKKSSQFRQEFKGFERQFWQTVDTTLQTNGFQEIVGVGPIFKEEHLYYFSQAPQVGYIRITRCFANPESIFDDNKEVVDIKLMLQLFDSLLTKLANEKAIIIDLRANGGGHGGVELASRFVKTKTLTHYKSIKQKGNYDTFSALEPQYILPNKGTQYLKQVIILTNDKTASSAEDFTISLYTQDNVTTIGANTSGMLSDMFGGELSNKISFTLSNQVYYSTDKEVLEDKGVPVSYKVENTMQDINNKKDSVITKAMEILNQKTAGNNGLKQLRVDVRTINKSIAIVL